MAVKCFVMDSQHKQTLTHNIHTMYTEMIQDHRNQLIAIDELMASEQTNTLKYREDEENQAKVCV